MRIMPVLATILLFAALLPAGCCGQALPSPTPMTEPMAASEP